VDGEHVIAPPPPPPPPPPPTGEMARSSAPVALEMFQAKGQDLMRNAATSAETPAATAEYARRQA